MRKQKGLLLLLCEFLECVKAFLQRQQSLFHPGISPDPSSRTVSSELLLGGPKNEPKLGVSGNKV